jgi:hypothetical protein
MTLPEIFSITVDLFAYSLMGSARSDYLLLYFITGGAQGETLNISVSGEPWTSVQSNTITLMSTYDLVALDDTLEPPEIEVLGQYSQLYTSGGQRLASGGQNSYRLFH